MSTETELKDALKIYRYSFDDISIRLKDNITVSGDLDLGKESLTLDLNYHSLSFVNSENGIIIDIYSWSEINIKNGFIFGADDSHSALNPREGKINITNVSIYGGKKCSSSAKGGHAISLKNSYSWTKVCLNYVLLVGGKGYHRFSSTSLYQYGDAIGCIYSWDKDKIKSVGIGYTIQYHK